MKNLTTLLLSLLCLFTSAQTTTKIDSVLKTGTYSYYELTKTVTNTVTKFDTIRISVRDTIRIHDTILKLVYVPCDTVIPPDTTTQSSRPLNCMYVSPIKDWIDNADSRLAWARREGVTDLSLYARAYLYNSTDQSKLAAFNKKAREVYGIKNIYVDYREVSELGGWKSFNDKYKGTTSALTGMNTEKEPYVTGDYQGFFSLINEGDKFCEANNLELVVYMGQPNDATWDSIAVHADRIFLSWYVPMSAWTNEVSGYNYVRNRLVALAKPLNKYDKNINGGAIMSLEQKKWFSAQDQAAGKYNNFTGAWYETHDFYNSTRAKIDPVFNNPPLVWGSKQWTKAETDMIKKRINFTDVIIFYSKYGVLAHPLN